MTKTTGARRVYPAPKRVSNGGMSQTLYGCYDGMEKTTANEGEEKRVRRNHNMRGYAGIYLGECID